MSEQALQSAVPALQKSIDERRLILAQHIQMADTRGGRVESQTATMAVIVYGKPVSHILHLLLTILTAGFWLVIWIIMILTGGEQRWLLTVDGLGNVINQQVHGQVSIPQTIVVSPVGASTPAASLAPASQSMTDKLTELKRILDDGLITETEYNAKRDELLRQI